MSTTNPPLPDDDGPDSHLAVLPADTPQDILSEAWRDGAAEPVSIHVRPELHARLLAQRGCTPLRVVPQDEVRPRARLSVVIDEEIPIAPGYEIHRAPPRAPNRPA